MIRRFNPFIVTNNYFINKSFLCFSEILIFNPINSKIINHETYHFSAITFLLRT